MALDEFVGLTGKRVDPKSGSVQSFDKTAVETPAENDTNTLKEHSVEAPPKDNLGAKNRQNK